jgi:hypothetical protein
MLILRQKSFQFCTTRLKTRQLITIDIDIPKEESVLVDKDISKEESEDRINSILISATIILNIILLTFFTKMILVLPIKPKIIDPVIFTQSSGITKIHN